MMKTNKFGRLLNEAAKIISHHQHITMSGFYLQLAEELYLSPHTLNNWRYGRRLPSSEEDVLSLAEALIRRTTFDRKYFDREWFESFLASADFVDAENFLIEHFPVAASAAPAQYYVFPPPPPESLPEIPYFIGRQAELASYRRQLQTNHFLIITGMPGVGKSTLAARLLQSPPFASKHVFWHTFRQNDEIEATIWNLAAFLAHAGRPAIWKSLQNEHTPPPMIILRAIVQTLKEIDSVICFDDYHAAIQEKTFNQLIQPILNAVDVSLSLIIISRRMPTHFSIPPAAPLDGLSIDDASWLLAHHGIHLDEEAINALYQTSQGNPQLLILAIAMSKQGKNIASFESFWDSEAIARYLLLEIYQGLNEQERAVMRAVSIFDGEFATRTAIEHILDEGSQLQTILSLVERYLLISKKVQNESTFSQHAVVRKFFYELMSESERKGLHRKTAGYFELNHYPLLAAFHYEQADIIDEAIRLVPENPQQYIGQGKVWLLERLTQRLVKKLGESATLADNSQYAKLMKLQGAVYRTQGRYQQAVEAYQNAYNSNMEDDVKAEFEYELGVTYEHLMLYEQAREYYERSLTRYLSLHDVGGISRAYRGLGWVSYRQGMTNAAINYHQKSLEMAEKSQDDYLIACSKFGLGTTTIHVHEYENAKQLIEESRRFFHRCGDRLLEAKATGNIGYIFGQLGDSEQQFKYYESAMSLFQEIGDIKSQQIGHHNFVGYCLQKGEKEKAHTHAQKLFELAQMTNHPYHLCIANSDLTAVSLANNEIELALKYSNETRQLAEQLPDSIAVGIAFRSLGSVHHYLGEDDLAIEYLSKSIDIFKDFHAFDELALSQTLMKQLRNAIE